MTGRSHLLRILAGLAAAALVAAGCDVNADDAPPAADAPAAAVETSASIELSAAADGEAVVQPELWAMSARRPIPAENVGTPLKELEGGTQAVVSAAVAKAYYAFPDVAAVEIAPDLFAAWGLGAPRGAYAVPVTIWRIDDGGAALLGSVELPSGGSLRDGDAIRVFGGASAERAWLEAFGAAGAHGATYDLLLWDGGELVAVAEHFSSAPGNVVAPGAAAQLRDLNGDGMPELVLDRTDPYLLHYSSGVWAGDAAVLRLIGSEAREVGLAAPDATVGIAARREALAAIAFAEAGLWGLAVERAETAAQLGAADPQLSWNAIVIRERGSAALREAERNPVPWLGLLLAGEWGSAVAQLRERSLSDLLELEALLRDTPLAGLETDVAELIRAQATTALSAAEQLSSDEVAPIYLLRGLTGWWLDYGILPAADDLVEAIAGYAPESIVYDLLWVIGYRGG